MTDTKDYKDTVFLPATDFPMKAGLPQKEPAILAKWQADDLYGQLRKARAGREQFILHDGPPYANGDMHIGHALNHILKDMVCRTQSLKGKDAPYVPGWDCHGLPIEWKVEEQYRKAKKNKDEVPLEEFRAECRAYAGAWVDVQREQNKRLGVLGNWDKPYLTMDYDAEATIVAELLKVAESGQLYRGAKPVMWSPVEKTALAEAEVEYEDITSTQIDVAFEIVESPIPELVGAYAVIWTTTPWTIPVNQAIAYGPDVEYVLAYFGGFTPSGGWTGDTAAEAESQREKEVGAAFFDVWGDRHFLIASELTSDFAKRVSDTLGVRVSVFEKATFKGSDLAGTVARHPMAKLFPREGGGPSADGATLNQVQMDPRLRGGAQEAMATASASHEAMDPRLRGGAREGGAAAASNLNPASPLAEFFLRDRPFLPGDFVTTDSGTGLVHMAPDHGEDDFDLCKANGLEPVFAVEGDGKYRADWAWLGGQGSVINPKFNAPDGPICTDLKDAGGLLAASADYKHSYPHSWRSKAKVIYRCTPQWFVPMDRPIDVAPAQAGASGSGAPQSEMPASAGMTLRENAMQAIAATRFVPEKGRNRIGSMVEGRPDWVLSRQRAWGVPITLFVHRQTGQYLNDPAVNARIVAAVRADGVDAWNDARAQEYLGADYPAADFERVTDILDVWFDSGCTHAFVLESGRWPELVRRDGAAHPADLYLEGSDQHRGWFQSSLLQSCATRGRAPYKAVLTHGFTMDSAGKKMSKSLGNTVDPLKIMETHGADIIRLWALSVDFTEDHRIGDEILKGVADQYRKLRNTFRYLLGALDGFSDDERVAVAKMPELERYMLHLLADLDAKLARAVDDFDFNAYTRALSDFCNDDLSAFYFDIRKDSLYCDVGPAVPQGTLKRRAYRTVLDTLFHALVRYAAPVLVFTAEEVWGTRFPDAGSVHLLEWPELPDAQLRHPVLDTGLGSLAQEESQAPDQIRGDELVERWTRIRLLRSIITEAVEPLRRDKIIRSSLEADVLLSLQKDDPIQIDTEELAEVCIVASVVVDRNYNYPGDWPAPIAVATVTRTTHHKCGRCWRHLPK